MRIRPIVLATATVAALATAGGMAVAAPGTPAPAPAVHAESAAAPAAAAPAAPVPAPSAAIDTATTPIDAGTTARILASCLGAEASKYHPVIAVRTPVASADTDGVVVAVDSAHRYVQCETKGRTGTSASVPATFINDRLWSPGHLVEFFDSFGAPAGPGRYLTLGAGHYTSDVAKVTVSYGDDPTQYPTVMAGGAYVWTAALPAAHDERSGPPAPYVHAYDAHGKEIYNQKTQPLVKGAVR
ncbi:hypothetical protein ACIQBJ_06495 [Kitasatospora sp. NPDC088391]|uniref:hypothetical protein n=1 Tax=Kitasatospora sp. NPDC088391 TaxID=3364074 RepID=UPI0037F47BF8